MNIYLITYLDDKNIYHTQTFASDLNEYDFIKYFNNEKGNYIVIIFFKKLER